MTKIQISNDPNPFCQANCFEFGTFDIRICFEFRASIFEFPAFDTQTTKEPLCPASQDMGHGELMKGDRGDFFTLDFSRSIHHNVKEAIHGVTL